jgi:hypothetical protein
LLTGKLVGEFVTDVFVWDNGDEVAALQLTKDTCHLSPIYCVQGGTTTDQNVLSSSDSHALVGISDNYNNLRVLQIQVVVFYCLCSYMRDGMHMTFNERSGVVHTAVDRYMNTLTSFAGGRDGTIFNDLQ